MWPMRSIDHRSASVPWLSREMRRRPRGAGRRNGYIRKLAAGAESGQHRTFILAFQLARN